MLSNDAYLSRDTHTSNMCHNSKSRCTIFYNCSVPLGRSVVQCNVSSLCTASNKLKKHLHYFIFFVAVPILHWFTLVANLSELRVSAKHSSLGLMFTNIKVFELPPRLFCSRCVSLEFR